jgi:hypothetical protein
MVLTVAISCVNDYVSDCLYNSKVLHGRGMGDEAKLASYVYYFESSLYGSATP